ncbi:MAG: WHG domain-containing protein [Candidatus Rokubacteria bacterium]|nr:WHG domain-containing protein [Candidatus Rokubacteria bacterium]
MDPGARRAAAGQRASAASVPEITTASDLLRSTLVECQRAGFVMAGDPTELAVATWSATHGLAALLVDRQLEGRGAEQPEGLAERVTAAIFLGIAAPTARPGRSGTRADE